MADDAKADQPLIGTTVRIRAVLAKDPVVLERAICFVGETGTVMSGPDSSGSFWVAFRRKCKAHNDSGAVFYPTEFEIASR